MTARETPSPDVVMHLLDEAGIAEDPALVRAVRAIGDLGAGPAPEVTAELAQLMAEGGKAPSDRRHKRRITFIGGALAVSMGVGMSGVAAGTFHLADGLTEAVESVARFSIRAGADRADPLPDAQAGQDDGGGRGVVAPSSDVPAHSLVEPVPAPSAAGEADRVADGGPSTGGTGPSVAQAASRGPVDAAPSVPVGTAPSVPVETVPFVPVQAAPAAAVPPPAAAPPAALPPARQAPPLAVPPTASPVAPTGSAPAPGLERRAVHRSPGPGGHAPASPVLGNRTSGDPVPGNGTANGQGPEVRQLRQARAEAPVGPEAGPQGKGGPSTETRAASAPHGRARLLAPAGGPGHVPSAPMTANPDRSLGEPAPTETTFVPAPVPTSGDPAEVTASGHIPPDVPTSGSAPDPAADVPAAEHPAADPTEVPASARR